MDSIVWLAVKDFGQWIRTRRGATSRLSDFQGVLRSHLIPNLKVDQWG